MSLFAADPASVKKQSGVSKKTLLGEQKESSKDSYSGEHMMGTSICAVSFNGGVILGADSRTSTGSYVANRVSDKISPLHDRIWCLRSGSAADTQAISDMVQYYLSIQSIEADEAPKVKTAASMVSDICYSNKDRLLAGMIVAGWDKQKGGTVYNIPLGGSLIQQPFAIGGSGSTYIFGYCDANYKDGMSRADCQAFVTKALSHAMSRDGASGGIIRLVIIDERGVERKYINAQSLPFTGHYGLD